MFVLFCSNDFRPPFSDISSLYFSRSVKDQVLHPHKSINKSIQLYVLIFIFLESKQKDKMFCTESYQIFSEVKINCVAKDRIPERYSRQDIWLPQNFKGYVTIEDVCYRERAQEVQQSLCTPESHRAIGGIVLLSLNFGTGLRRVGGFTFLSLYVPLFNPLNWRLGGTEGRL